MDPLLVPAHQKLDALLQKLQTVESEADLVPGLNHIQNGLNLAHKAVGLDTPGFTRLNAPKIQ